MQQKTGALALLSGERTLRALELRKQGQTYVAIASELGVTPQAVHKRVAKVLQVMTKEAEEERELLRRLEAERLDALQVACWERAMQGNLQAVDRVLRIMTARARLYQLDNLPEQSGPGFAELVKQVAAVTRGYDEPMPAPEDDGTMDRDWWEPERTTIIEALPELEEIE